MTILGLSMSKIVVLDNVQDLRQLAKGSYYGNLHSTQRLLEMDTTHAGVALDTHKKLGRNLEAFDKAISKLDDLEDVNYKRLLDNSTKLALTTGKTSQHKFFGFGSKKYICYKSNGSYRTVSLKVSTKRWSNTMKG